MKKYTLYSVIVIICFCSQSCTSDDTKTYNEKAALPATSLPANNPSTPSTTSSPSVNGVGAQATPGTANPPHGQPGHRCGEAVGTATASAPSVGNASNNTPVTKAPSLPATALENSSVKLNPAHGQPGHQCGISVGAPLNSKSAPASIPTATIPASATPTTKNIPSPVQPTVTPVQTLPDATKAGSGKLNPAHGQPGHDCTIAVGAPLKQ